jgi:hypothetical protein
MTVNEAMIAFRGRIFYKIKMKNKPIDEGYKTWMAAQSGYTLLWKWHSKLEGPEDVSKEGITAQIGPSTSIYLAPTFAVVLVIARLLREVYPDQPFHFFLDNLFLNVPVARALLFLSILCIGTTRKNALGFPDWLVNIKNKNTALVWNSVYAQVVKGVLYFL